MARRLLRLGGAVVVMTSIVLGGLAAPVTHIDAASAAPDERPNVVLIVTDDQRWDTLWAMPNVRSLLGDAGVTFTNAFVSNPACCPSRASILTGTYSHTNGVWTNQSWYGGFTAFDESSTLATWLQAAGYRTSLIGKYLNGYHGPGSDGYVPVGWDRWWSFVGGRYFGYSVNDDGQTRTYGWSEQDYVMDAMTDEAEAFIAGSEQPFFLYLTPKAPHMPATPAPRHADAFSDLAPWRPASWNEANVRDKPGWVRKLPAIDDARAEILDRKRLDMLRSLLALDEGIGRLVGTLEQQGELDRTLFIFTSDNGYAWGEHRWDRKAAPYEEIIRVPLVIRYDPLTSGTNDARFAVNVDIAPTIAEITGIDAPAMEGMSLVPLLRGERPGWRRDFLLEHLGKKIPGYCGVRSKRYTYVYHATGEQELYDLVNDPSQLTNLAGDAGYAKLVARRLARLRELCTIPPPGLELPPLGV